MNFFKKSLHSLLTIIVFCLLSSQASVAETYPALTDSVDPVLQRNLERVIKSLGLDRAVKSKLLSLDLVDITDLDKPRVAAINGEDMVYAASLPKIAILLGAFVEIERGKMKLDEDTYNTLTNMIRYSSNQAATEMYHRVGEARLAEILQSDRYKLYDRDENGGLWVGKEYGKAKAWKRDPLHNISHGATAFQTARFYYLLETGRLVSEPLASKMKEILSKPAINHKFVKGMEIDRPGAKIYRKSGSWKTWHADSAIIESGGHKFIVVALAKHRNGGKWLQKMIVPLHDLIVPNVLASNDQQLYH
ncbi:MAG: serine hydrolase [Gammaproteobacteria bacterium]|nr:serine hydrolase [Gammaproteobacteria bacterium]